jgi:hypothetical protein
LYFRTSTIKLLWNVDYRMKMVDFPCAFTSWQFWTMFPFSIVHVTVGWS